MSNPAYTQKILQLFHSKEEENKALAIQLCVGLKDNYSKEVAEALRQQPWRCIPHGVELCYFQQFLEVLEVKGEQLTEIPEVIFSLKKLKKLSLPSNQIKVILPQIRQLKQLVALNLQNNQLTNLPHEIEHLQQLEILELKNNTFACLPKTIVHNKQLKTLNLSLNNLIELPANIENLHLL